MIDSHCHLDHEPLLSDLSNVIQRSKDIGIEKLLTISTSFESFSRVKELINKDDIIYGTIGIHPHESSTNIITTKQIIENLSENPKIIGIGETGLDFYYNNSEKKKQIALNAGGLYVIGTERHDSRRVDRQLMGRSGRQGDPGSAQFFVSLEAGFHS